MAGWMHEMERREHERLSIKKRGDAVLFGPDSAKGVQILDLSLGGVAFRYVAACDRLVEPLKLDLLWHHECVRLLKLKIEVVSDFQAPNEYLLGIIPIRRCGARFVDLTDAETAQLSDFLANHSPEDVQACRAYAVGPGISSKGEQRQWKNM